MLATESSEVKKEQLTQNILKKFALIPSADLQDKKKSLNSRNQMMNMQSHIMIQEFN